MELRTASTGQRGIGVYFGLLQLVFNLSWVIYVIYLPQLADQAGIAGWAVPWILLADQLIFVLCDWATGLASDTVANIVGRLGKIVAGVTALSALAFLLLPLATHLGTGLFLALTITWAVTSSALRAPPLTLIGRYTPPDQQPLMSSLFLLGLGISEHRRAVSRRLGHRLRPTHHVRCLSALGRSGDRVDHVGREGARP